MNILFVCSGNTCRSPMACGIFYKLIEKFKLKDVSASSAGIFANNHSKASENAIKVCDEISINLKEHISKNINDVNLNKIDKFIVMTENHKVFLKNLDIPDDKIYVLGNQISDPFGGDLSVYRICRDQIFEALSNFVKNNFINDKQPKY